ncbi:MAG TPA: efflux RND transporter periplasmic adaptor subunit, partial [Gammaproteobacteria bacterium]|nr:efflux RND transporter periplasmic adaptor subunit [Gammaproteobacteria bacterium]
MKKFSAKKYCFLLFLWFIYSVNVQANVPVTVADVKTLIFYPTYEVSASVLSLHNSLISSEIHGRVEILPFLVGDIVKEGSVIAKLDCTDQQYILEQVSNARDGTKAKIEVAQWQLQQFDKLAKEQHVSTERLKTLASELQFLQAQQKIEDSKINQAKNHLSKCSIKAPFNAIVTARSISLGEFASPGVPVMQLLSSDKLEVQAKLHPKEA